LAHEILVNVRLLSQSKIKIKGKKKREKSLCKCSVEGVAINNMQSIVVGNCLTNGHVTAVARSAVQSASK